VTHPALFGILRGMGFIEDFKADLQQLQVESQRDLVVQVLRSRVGEMTFDELRALLSSPLGRGLGSTRVGEVLAVGTPPSTQQPVAPTKAKVTAKAKKGRAKARKKRPTKAGRVAAVRKDLRPDVLARLQSASKPLNLRELVEALGADPRTIRKALEGLLAEGSIVASGRVPKLRYAAAEKPQKAARAPRAKKAGRQKAAVTGRTVAGKAAYEAAVLAALRDAGERAPISALIEKTGGTDNQLRAALHRLIAAGKVDRVGERDRTRYSLRLQPSST
jgi:hypothetical protein